MEQTMQYITIVHAWHDDNRGDCAMLMGMLTALYQRWPHVHISLISSFAAADPAFDGAYRHTLKAFPKLEIIPAPFWAYSTLDRQGKGRQIRTLLSGLQALCRLLVPLPSKQLAMERMAKTDLVLSAGGHTQPVTQHWLKSCYLVFRSLYFLFWARRYGIPYGVFGQSFDLRGIQEDITEQSLHNRLDARLLRFVLSHAVAIWPRDVISLQALVSLGIPKSQLTLMADASFYLTPVSDQEIHAVASAYDLQTISYWVVTVKQCGHTPLLEIASLIEQILKTGKADRVAIVAQSIGPTADEDDRQANHRLMEHLSSRGIGSDRVSAIEDDLTPHQLTALYGGAQCVVGMRLQSVMLALAAGTPVYAIAYTYPKTQGLMAMMDMEHLCSTLEDFSAMTALTHLSTADMSKLRQKISANVQVFRQRILDAVNSIDSGSLEGS